MDILRHIKTLPDIRDIYRHWGHTWTYWGITYIWIIHEIGGPSPPTFFWRLFCPPKPPCKFSPDPPKAPLPVAGGGQRKSRFFSQNEPFFPKIVFFQAKLRHFFARKIFRPPLNPLQKIFGRPPPLSPPLGKNLKNVGPPLKVQTDFMYDLQNPFHPLKHQFIHNTHYTFISHMTLQS